MSSRVGGRGGRTPKRANPIETQNLPYFARHLANSAILLTTFGLRFLPRSAASHRVHRVAPSGLPDSNGYMIANLMRPCLCSFLAPEFLCLQNRWILVVIHKNYRFLMRHFLDVWIHTWIFVFVDLDPIHHIQGCLETELSESGQPSETPARDGMQRCFLSPRKCSSI